MQFYIVLKYVYEYSDLRGDSSDLRRRALKNKKSERSVSEFLGIIQYYMINLGRHKTTYIYHLILLDKNLMCEILN